jgi:hypothetical protein
MTTLPSLSEDGDFYDNAVAGAAEFAEVIRDSSRDQVGYWRQLPLLGLLRWGNVGVYSTEDVTLYEKGIISVDATNSSHRLFGTYVDCESGDILFVPDGHFAGRQPANDKLVIKAWLSQVANRGIDAREIVGSYKTDVAQQRKPKNKDMDLETHLGILTPRRLAIAKKLGLRATFRRDDLLRGAELDVDTRDAITSVDSFFDATRF